MFTWQHCDPANQQQRCKMKSWNRDTEQYTKKNHTQSSETIIYSLPCLNSSENQEKPKKEKQSNQMAENYLESKIQGRKHQNMEMEWRKTRVQAILSFLHICTVSLRFSLLSTIFRVYKTFYKYKCKTQIQRGNQWCLGKFKSNTKQKYKRKQVMSWKI